MRRILEIFCFTISALLWVGFLQARESIEVNRFISRTESHILRLAVMGNALLQNSQFLAAHPRFRDLSEKRLDVMVVLLNHDNSKLIKTSANLLANRYGLNWEALDSRTKQRYLDFENDLNIKDESIILKELNRLNFTSLEIELFLSLEKLIDKYDRFVADAGPPRDNSFQAVESLYHYLENQFVNPEFGKMMLRPSTYFKDAKDNLGGEEAKRLLDMYVWLEHSPQDYFYWKIVKGYTIDEYKRDKVFYSNHLSGKSIKEKEIDSGYFNMLAAHILLEGGGKGDDLVRLYRSTAFSKVDAHQILQKQRKVIRPNSRQVQKRVNTCLMLFF